MTDPTPMSNAQKITRLEGAFKTLEVKVEGDMQRQTDAIENIKDSTSRLENSVNSFVQSSKVQHKTHFERGEDQALKMTAFEGRLNGHEALSKERDTAIQQKIDMGFKQITEALAAEQNKESAVAEARKESSSNWKWWLAVIVPILLAIIGWIH